MSRPVLVFALAAALSPGLLMAATTVYKSKNADGTTVYSQIETRDAQAQRVDGRDPAVDPAPAAATEEAKTPAQKACEGARNNLRLIESGARLQRDKDGDGQPDTDMTPEEIASEKEIAERQAAANCPPEG